MTSSYSSDRHKLRTYNTYASWWNFALHSYLFLLAIIMIYLSFLLSRLLNNKIKELCNSLKFLIQAQFWRAIFAPEMGSWSSWSAWNTSCLRWCQIGRYQGNEGPVLIGNYWLFFFLFFISFKIKSPKKWISKKNFCKYRCSSFSFVWTFLNF